MSASLRYFDTASRRFGVILGVTHDIISEAGKSDDR